VKGTFSPKSLRDSKIMEKDTAVRTILGHVGYFYEKNVLSLLVDDMLVEIVYNNDVSALKNWWFIEDEIALDWRKRKHKRSATIYLRAKDMVTRLDDAEEYTVITLDNTETPYTGSLLLGDREERMFSVLCELGLERYK
jgi:hypothetical protein